MRRVTRTGIPLRVASQEADLDQPPAIVYDLPPDFWHPCMGPQEEDKVGDIEDEDNPPNWLSRLGGIVIAFCLLAIVVAVTARIVAWVLEGM